MPPFHPPPSPPPTSATRPSAPDGDRPLVLLTCGDPAGIGPEVVCLAWARASAHARARLRVVGAAETLATCLATRAGMPALRIVRCAADDVRASDPTTLLVVDGDDAPPAADTPAARGRAAASAVTTAARLALAGGAAAIVTAPLDKSALHAAGYDVPGHTELLARSCGLPDDAVSMMLWLPSAGARGLAVVHATLHESLRTALDRLSTAGIVAAGRRLADVLPALVGRSPRIAVAALNPHGGEAGLFGDDEARLVAPAVAALAAAGFDVEGPLPADTLFVRAHAGHHDGIVALYHDQGHIPIKLLGMHRAVNVTLGLPLVRTSVAHGTAVDIVGTGTADPTSMLSAIDAATRLVEAGWPGIRAASGPTASPADP